jgi:FkbM family methyltransferase
MVSLEGVLRAVRRLVRNAGFDINRFPPDVSREAFFKRLNIDVVLDVGANEGQYASDLREMGYRGRIISFEPLSEQFDLLEQRSSTDEQWDCLNLALGDDDGEATINKAEYSVFSSFLETTDFIEELDPGSVARGQEKVRIRRLDGVLEEMNIGEGAVWLKIDTQGYELTVLDGASSRLDRFAAVQLEMSLRAAYEGQPGFESVRSFMGEKGFVLAAILPGFIKPDTNELVEVDGIFLRVG